MNEKRGHLPINDRKAGVMHHSHSVVEGCWCWSGALGGCVRVDWPVLETSAFFFSVHFDSYS